MKFSTHIDKKKNLRSHVVEGKISFREVKDQLTEIYESQEFNPDMNVLWDLRKTEFSLVKSTEVNSLVALVKKHWGLGGKSKAALIVSGKLGYGLSRMYEILMNGVTPSKVVVFKSIEEANKWMEG